MIEWFDDLTLGMRFKSGEVSVTAEDIKRFASEFDPQPFHLDEAAARESAFKGLAASGWHTAAISMALTVELRPFGPHPLMGLGVDELRWMMPVRPGDVLHLEGEVVELTPSRTKPQGIAKIKWTAYNQRGEAVYTFHADRHCAPQAQSGELISPRDETARRRAHSKAVIHSRRNKEAAAERKHNGGLWGQIGRSGRRSLRVQPTPGVQTEVRADVRRRRHVSLITGAGEAGFSGRERTRCGFLRAVAQLLQSCC